MNNLSVWVQKKVALFCAFCTIYLEYSSLPAVELRFLQLYTPLSSV